MNPNDIPISKKQNKLLSVWMTAPRFRLNKHDKVVVRRIISDRKYSTIKNSDNSNQQGFSQPTSDRDILMHLRNRWIKHLLEERTWVYITRNEKNLLTNEILNSKKTFRDTLIPAQVDFLVEVLKTGRYTITKEDTFKRIIDSYELYITLPF